MTTTMPYNQWALLNKIYSLHGRGPSAVALMGLADTDIDDLLALEEHGFITAEVDGEPVLVDLVKHMLHRVNLRLTPAGRKWLTSDPRNRVLTYLGTFFAGRASLREAAGSLDVDADVFAALEDAGLLRITVGVDGEPVRAKIQDALRNPGHLVKVQLTPAARHLVSAAA